jgi:hypothetical protein
MRISSFGKWGLLAMVAAIGAMGCSEKPTDSGPEIVDTKPGDDPDPCTLAADAELEGITVRKPVRHMSETYAGSRRCTWYDAENYALFVVSIDDEEIFEPSFRSILQYAPVAGVGDDAFLSGGATVYVRTPKLVFFAQSLFSVADGKVSDAVQTAESLLATQYKDDVLRYEGGYRLAKIVVGKL